MSTSTRIRAKSRSKSIVFLFLSLISIIYVLHNPEKLYDLEIILLVFVSILIIPFAIWGLMNSVFLTESGVVCYRLGREYKTIQWCQISQISIVRDTHWSFITSGSAIIVITPVGCEKYSKETWSGTWYLIAHRNKAMCIDNTKKNQQYIREYYGEIQNFAYPNSK